jgi:triphosphoribosyl-dephospho-CoA synthase
MNAVAEAVEWACRQEASAFKPGNVSPDSPGHGMTAHDFLLSAKAIAQPMAIRGYSVGERILAGIEATRQVVSCNTNLGIVLLFSPLIAAFYRQDNRKSLQKALKSVLQELTVDDAEKAYAAIRLANPGGLGHSETQDVRDKPTVTLLAAMQEAMERDAIALAYVKGYDFVFRVGLPALRNALRRYGSESWGILACYLALLAEYPDSLIRRKFGERQAQAVSAAARRWRDLLAKAPSPNAWMPQLQLWDAELKRDGLNPGTTADLTAAVLLIDRLQTLS